MAATEYVMISASHLKELQEMEKNLPRLIDEAVKEYKKAALEKLHERDRSNPATVNARVKRYVEKNR